MVNYSKVRWAEHMAVIHLQGTQRSGRKRVT